VILVKCFWFGAFIHGDKPPVHAVIALSYTGDFRDDSDVDAMVSFRPSAHVGVLSLAKKASKWV
jgi:hypothetical protein